MDPDPQLKVKDNNCYILFRQDIDQLTRIMMLVGKPDEKLMTKLGSEEVRERRCVWWLWLLSTIYPPPPSSYPRFIKIARRRAATTLDHIPRYRYQLKNFATKKRNFAFVNFLTREVWKTSVILPYSQTVRTVHRQKI